MRDKRQRRMDSAIVFFIALIPRLILIFCFAGIFRTPMDEMSTISTGAYFGGKDWTALTTYARFYYGGGFTILFAPLFRMIDNTLVVYYIMLSVCAVLQSISAPISYYIMDRFLKIENRKYLILGSLACSFMVVTRAMEVFNEHIIIGCVWISVLLLCKLIENEKRKALYSVLLMVVFSYLLTTHTRTKVLWIAFALTVIAYRIVYRKWLVSVVPTVVTAIIGYWGAGRFNDMVKTVIWNWQEGEYLRNTSIDLGISLSDLGDPVFWQGIFSVIFGQINTVIVFTGGIAVIFIIALAVLYKDVLRERFAGKEIIEDEGSLSRAKPYITTISFFFILCTGAVIAAQSLTWLSGLVDALKESTYATNAYDYKAITYVRYMGPFLGPIFLCGASVLYHKKEAVRGYLLPSFVTIGIFQMIWIGFILPHIYKSRAASEVFTAFGWYDIVNSTRSMGLSVYLMGSAALVVVFGACCIFYRKKNVLAPIIICLCLLGYEYGYGAVFWDGSYVDSYGSRADAGAELIKKLEVDESYADKLPDTIYVLEKKKGVQKRMYTYQMLLSNYTIAPDRPEDEEMHIVFSSKSKDRILLVLHNIGECARIDWSNDRSAFPLLFCKWDR